MTRARDDHCILVVSETIGDAELVQRLLSFEYGDVRISTDPLRRAEEFDRSRPDVLVLVFNSIDKAERCSGELKAQSETARRGRHRTLVLCTREEVQKSYDLCKLGIFDDYVLFWPLTHDTPRLLFAVRQAIKHPRDVGEQKVAHADGSTAQPPNDLGESPEPPGKPLVLMIDDDPFQHRLLERMLAAEALECIFATSAQQGLELMHQRGPRVVLMDIKMPDIDGVEATRRIRALRQFQSIPVVMVTGLGTRDRVVESRLAGASGFLVKPLDREALLKSLRQLGVLGS